MVIPIFIHKHDQQIPRTMQWSRGAAWLLADCAQFVCGCGQFVCCGSQQLLSSVCSFCSSHWGSCLALFLFQVRCVQLFLEPFDSFGYTQAAFNLNQYTASECGRFEQVPLLLSIALSRSRHTFAIHFERHSLRCIAPFKRFQSGFVLQSNGCSITNVS